MTVSEKPGPLERLWNRLRPGEDAQDEADGQRWLEALVGDPSCRHPYGEDR